MILKLGKDTYVFYLQNYLEKEGRWRPLAPHLNEGPPSFPAAPHPQSPVARSHPPGGCLSGLLMVCLVKTVGLAFFLA